MGFQNEALDLFLTKSEKEAKEISDPFFESSLNTFQRTKKKDPDSLDEPEELEEEDSSENY